MGVAYCVSIGNSDRFSVHMEALRTYLELTETTQSELARRVGVSQPTISDIINGVHSPSMELLKRLTKVTGLSADKLIAN